MRCFYIRWLVIFCCFFLVFEARGQVSLASLEKELSQTSDEKQKVNILCQMAEVENNNQRYQQAKHHAEQAFILADKLNDNEGKAKSLLMMGKISRERNQFDLALENFLHAVSLFENGKNESELVSAYSETGLLYQKWGSYEKAAHYFEKSYELVKKQNNKEREIIILDLLAYSYYKNNNNMKALQYYDEILNFYKERKNNKLLAQSYNSMANLYKENKDFDSAIKYTQESLSLYESIKDDFHTAQTLNNLGFLWQQKKNTTKSLECFQKAIEVFKNMSSSKKTDVRQQAAIFSNIGVIYDNLGDFAQAGNYFREALKIWTRENNQYEIAKVNNYNAINSFLAGEYDRAIAYANEAIEIARRNNDIYNLQESYKILSQINQKRNNYKEANRYDKLHASLKDSIASIEKQNQQELFETELIIEKKESEFKLLISDRERKELELAQLKSEREKQAYELQLLTKQKDLQQAEIRNKQLEKERIQQMLALANQEIEAEKQKQKAEEQRQEIEQQKQEAEKQRILAEKQKAENTSRQNEIEVMKKEKELQTQELEQEKIVKRYGLWIMILIAIVMVMAILGLWNTRKAKKDLEAKNAEIQRQQDEIVVHNEELRQLNEEMFAQRQDLDEKKKLLEQKNLKIMDSIRYAHTIQNSILPFEKRIRSTMKDAFVIYRPKDIVSGDFFWLSKEEDYIFVAVADCTGHGVPGAFMSMLGYALLNEMVNEKHYYNPEEALESFEYQLRKALRQDEGENRDGMDVALCRIEYIHTKTAKVIFAGAKIPLYTVKNNTLTELKGTKRAIGGLYNKKDKPFERQEIVLNEGDMLYLASDGFADQNNTNLQKFGSTQLKKMLSEIAHLPTERQKAYLERALEEHSQGVEQRDDITLWGIRI